MPTISKYLHYLCLPRYGNIADLLFSDEVVQLQRIELPDQLYRTVLKRRYGNSEVSPQENINGIRRCEIQTVRMCVTSRSGKLLYLLHLKFSFKRRIAKISQ